MKQITIYLVVFMSLYLIMNNNYCLADRTDDALTQLETRILAGTYKNDDYETRLNRLENKMFGAQQRGNIEQRITKLLESNSFYCYEEPQEYSAIVDSNKGIKGFWNKIKSEYTNGIVTGYTPSMYNSYDFGNNYPFNRFNSTLPNHHIKMNDFNNFYTPINNSNFGTFKHNFPSYNPISDISYNNQFSNRHYNRNYLPSLINNSAFGGTKVTLIKD